MPIPQLKLNGDWKLPSKSGYSLKFISGISSRMVSGGLPIVQATGRVLPIPITATYELGSQLEIERFYLFYNDEISEGSLPFEAKLDVCGSLAVYTCQLSDEISFQRFTGEYASVVIPMYVLVDINSTDLLAVYNAATLDIIRYTDPSYVDEQYTPTSY